MQHRGSEDRLFIGLKKLVFVGYTVVVAGRFVINFQLIWEKPLNVLLYQARK